VRACTRLSGIAAEQCTRRSSLATVTAEPQPPAPATERSSQPGWIERNHFWLRRLHSLSGIVPVGGFLLFHFYENGAIFYGAGAYDSMAEEARGIRYLEIIEIAVVFIPFLYHALYGLFIAAYGRNNAETYTYSRNNLFMWQRFTGVVLLLFILYHIWQFRFDSFRETHADAGTVAAALSIFPVFVFYIVGILSAGFHLGNGLFTFLITWGITVGQRAQRISQIISTAVAIIVSVIGIAIAAYFVSLSGGFVWWFA
jgi:succinate dehydrogenase / fumarate reductase cytochrome b subunit